MNFTILEGDNRETLKTLDDNSVDAIVTDPPYGIDFLGKAWDANTGALETYTECLRVLKPGGYILAFSAARTYHHLAVTLEQAGFEIRDQIMWIYSSGFPKAQDIGKAIDKRKGNTGKKGPLKRGGERLIKQTDKNGNRDNSEGVWENEVNRDPYTYIADNEWAGWKTALKPAHEPICMGRKPFKGSTIDNVLEHGVGALNIDATRINVDKEEMSAFQKNWDRECAGAAHYQKLAGTIEHGTKIEGASEEEYSKYKPEGRFPSNVLGKVEGYQKYFYCPKVSRKERHCGFEQKDIPKNPQGMWDDGVQFQERKQKQDPLSHIPAPFGDVKGAYVNGERMAKVADDTGYANVGNNHPTVKPVALMRYLIKLVTPANSVVLDPFNGSGSTGMAAVELGHTYIGCELDPAYAEIARTRIKAWNTPEPTGTTFEELFE